MVAVNFPNENWRNGFEESVRSGSIDQFLGTQVIDRHRAGGLAQTATVRDLIKHYANREGGVHYDPGGKSANEFIEQIRDFADEDLRRTVSACGRIVVRALEPIVVAATLKDKPWPVACTSPTFRLQGSSPRRHRVPHAHPTAR